MDAIDATSPFLVVLGCVTWSDSLTRQLLRLVKHLRVFESML
jgi:hypothetical protein